MRKKKKPEEYRTCGLPLHDTPADIERCCKSVRRTAEAVGRVAKDFGCVSTETYVYLSAMADTMTVASQQADQLLELIRRKGV